MPKPATFEVTTDAGLRIDKWLATRLYRDEQIVTRSTIKQIINNRGLKVNGAVKVAANYLAQEGDFVEVNYAVLNSAQSVTAQDIAFETVYEDRYLLVINKPNNLVVHPGIGNRDNTLVNGLLAKYHDLSAIGDPNRPGLVHRIDKNTTGLLVVAKTNPVLLALQGALQKRLIHRTYHALVHRVLKHNELIIRAPIGRSRYSRTKMAVTKDGRPAVTRVKVLKRYPQHTLVQCDLETGRTHQIRVHLAYIRHPIVGDYTYGLKREGDSFGQYLHACQLVFEHPVSKKKLKFKAPYPAEWTHKMLELSR